MFISESLHSLDDKGRLTLPMRHRRDLSNTFYCLIDFDHCISIYSDREYEERAEPIRKLSSFNPDARRLKRIFFSNSLECKLDGNGRLLLPKSFLEKAHINKEVVLIGVWDHLEIWDASTYKQNSKSDDEDYESLATKMSGAGKDE